VPLAHEFGGHMSPVLQDWTRKKSAGASGSRRNDNFTPRLHVLRASALVPTSCIDRNALVRRSRRKHCRSGSEVTVTRTKPWLPAFEEWAHHRRASRPMRMAASWLGPLEGPPHTTLRRVDTRPIASSPLIVRPPLTEKLPHEGATNREKKGLTETIPHKVL
jgi:hypothetical protein